MKSEQTAIDRGVPPYVSFRAFQKFLEDLRGRIMPTRVDRSVMNKRSGAVKSQLMNALRYLRLISPNGVATDRLARLVSSAGNDRAALLRETLNSSYPFLFKGFDLQRATPKLVEQRFREAGASGDTVRKCIAFFLAAAREANLPISPHIGAGRRSHVLPRKGRDGASSIARRLEPSSPEAQSGTWGQQLLSKFPSFDPTWPDDVKTKWFEAFNQLMKFGQNAGTD